MHHYSVKLETVKQTITTSKHSIEFTHCKLSCHLKMNRDKLVLIIHLWKSKNGKRLTITTNSFMKTDHLDKFSGPDEKITPRNKSGKNQIPGTNQIAGFC